MVREKEVGTIEQINVTPVRKYHFIIAKMTPFLLIGLIDLAIGLILGKIAFNIPFEGSILLMFLGSTIFLIAVLGIGFVYINLLCNTAAIYVCCIFLYDNIYSYERNIYSL